MAALYVGAGVIHFVVPQFYVGIMPAWLPWPNALVALSGVAEIALGLGLLWHGTRKWSAWLIATMLLVFGLLIHVPMSIRYGQEHLPGFGLTLLRLALQPLLVWWAVRVAKGK